ncbi:MAG: hypothetical protein IJU02_07360 [Lachnospiraceae bacterium]|nr:hypothetical protein [Lachnospiraceae bacterium]
MNNNRKRWTEDEDLVVYRLVKDHLENMKVAFEEAANQLGRTPNAVCTRWYSYISKQQGSMAFMLLSESKSWPNRKNPKENTPKLEVKKSLWNKILRALGIS